MEIDRFLLLLILYGIPVLIAITFHEAAHGFVALRFGDSTAKDQGRLTLNPLRHMDLFGTLLLPSLLIFLGSPFLFGYAKPVPVAFHRLSPLKVGLIAVAAAGPLTNILLALLSAFLIKMLYIFLMDGSSPLGGTLYIVQGLIFSIHINVTLALFNMLPIPPLDGGRIITGLLPAPYDRAFGKIERYGFLIVFVLFFLMPATLGQFHPSFRFFNELLHVGIQEIKKALILPVTGLEI